MRVEWSACLDVQLPRGIDEELTHLNERSSSLVDGEVKSLARFLTSFIYFVFRLFDDRINQSDRPTGLTSDWIDKEPRKWRHVGTVIGSRS